MLLEIRCHFDLLAGILIGEIGAIHNRLIVLKVRMLEALISVSRVLGRIRRSRTGPSRRGVRNQHYGKPAPIGRAAEYQSNCVPPWRRSEERFEANYREISLGWITKHTTAKGFAEYLPGACQNGAAEILARQGLRPATLRSDAASSEIIRLGSAFAATSRR